jgi:hypothetical protein
MSFSADRDPFVRNINSITRKFVSCMREVGFMVWGGGGRAGEGWWLAMDGEKRRGAIWDSTGSYISLVLLGEDGGGDVT